MKYRLKQNKQRRTDNLNNLFWTSTGTNNYRLEMILHQTDFVGDRPNQISLKTWR